MKESNKGKSRIQISQVFSTALIIGLLYALLYSVIEYLLPSLETTICLFIASRTLVFLIATVSGCLISEWITSSNWKEYFYGTLLFA